MNATEYEVAAVKQTTTDQAEAARKELLQLQLAMMGGCTGETILL